MKRISLLCVLVVALCAIASANIIPTLNPGNPTGVGPYTWSYHFDLSSDQNAFSGPAPTINPVPTSPANVATFVTIYDFAGFIAGTCTSPAGWVCTAQNVGFTPSAVNPGADSASIVNLTWAYVTGPTIVGASTPLLGTFTAQSTYGVPTSVSYASRALGIAGGGTIASNTGSTMGPNVPEPATLGLIGAGLIGLGLLRRRTRKS